MMRWTSIVLSCCALVACGEDPSEPKSPCGQATSGCDEREHCDRISVPNRCVCDETHSGSSCGECAPGYRSSGGSCVAATVICSDLPCGARGQCLDGTNGAQACVCEMGYTGNFCATCVDGYQDNDGDGVCQPSCGVASVICQGVEACSDQSGEARCQCAAGLTGPTCEDCEQGYRRDPASSACVPTCASSDFECSGTCIETLRGAECHCEPGYAGDSCDTCAPTHATNVDGDCVAPLPEDALLWTIVRTEQQSYVGGLVPPDFAFSAVVPVADSVTDVSYDSAGDVLYGVSSGSLVSIDRQTGELTSLLEAASGLGDALTRDPETGQLFVASADTVWSVDLNLGEATELSTPGASALDFDRARRLLLGVSADGERFELDPSDGTRITRSTLPAMTPLGLAVDASLGRAYALGALPESPEAKLERLCTGFAQALGVPRTTRGLALEFSDGLAGETRVLDATSPDPPLVAYGSLDGTAEGGTLRVETSHPDALICIVTVRESLEIVVTEQAAFELLMVVSEEPNVTLNLESGFAAPGAAIHVRVGGDLPLSGVIEPVTTYTDDEWEALGLPTWSTAPDLPQPVLGIVDWRSGSSAFVALDVPSIEGLSFAGEP